MGRAGRSSCPDGDPEVEVESADEVGLKADDGTERGDADGPARLPCCVQHAACDAGTVGGM